MLAWLPKPFLNSMTCAAPMDNETRAHDRFHKLKRQYKQLDHKLDRLMHEEHTKRALSNSSHLHN